MTDGLRLWLLWREGVFGFFFFFSFSFFVGVKRCFLGLVFAGFLLNRHNFGEYLCSRVLLLLQTKYRENIVHLRRISM